MPSERACTHARLDMSKPCPACPKRRYLVVPEELTDGDHKTIIDIESETERGCLLDMLCSWFNENAEVGERITFGVIEMTDEEVANMPEV